MLSGRRLDLLAPSPFDIEIEDIALGLSRLVRWNGQTVYYAAEVMKGMVVTADYQFLGNPAYNMARGPVNVFSGRLRLSF
jgi:hypothetical protein